VAAVVCLGGLVVTSVAHVALEAFRSLGPLRAVRQTSTLAVAYGIPAALGTGGLIAVATVRVWQETTATSPFPRVDDQMFTGPLAPGVLFVAWTLSALLSAALLWVAVAVLAGLLGRVTRRPTG
jgi:hypothetical protein